MTLKVVSVRIMNSSMYDDLDDIDSILENYDSRGFLRYLYSDGTTADFHVYHSRGHFEHIPCIVYDRD